MAERPTPQAGSLVRLLRVFAWLRWRLLLNSFKGTGRRDSLERVSRAAASIAPIIFAVLFIPGLIACGALAFVGGYLFGGGGENALVVGAILGTFFTVITVAVLVAPLVRSIKRSDFSFTRFLLLPIPRPLLHLLDLAAGLMDPWVTIAVPVVLLFPAGLAVSGAAGTAVIALVAGLLLLAIFLTLESCLSHALALLYRSRRRGEMASLVILVAFSMVGFLPALLGGHFDNGHSRRRHRETPAVEGEARPGTTAAKGAAGGEETPAVDTDSGPSVTIPRLGPSAFYGRAIRSGTGFASSRALALGALAILAAALYGISWSAYRRLLDSPEISTSRRGRASSRVSILKFPGLGPAASAVAFARMKLSLRTIQGKMAVYYSPIVMMVAAFAMTRLTDGGLIRSLGPHAGPILVALAALLTLIYMNRLMLNQFATDGAGLTLQFLSPVSGRDIVAGNGAGLGVFFCCSMIFYVLVAAIFAPDPSVWLWGASFVAGLSVYLVFAPIAAMLSALFPKGVDLSAIGSASNPSSAASLLGMLLMALCAAPPFLLGALGLLFLKSAALSFLLEAVWVLFAAVLSAILVRLAAKVVIERQENLAMVAERR